MKRDVYLSEIIEELQKALTEQGDKEIDSIGTTSGENSSFIFREKGTPIGGGIKIKAFREK